MTAPLASVVIPAYNKAGTIRATLRSVLGQTVQDLEILVVDDGSTDETRAMVETFGHGVRVLAQRQAGVSAARNHGIREARGEYVAFLDADDLWLPRKLEAQVALLRREPRLDAVQCGAFLVDNHLDVLGARTCRPAQDTLLDFLLFRNLPGLGSTLLARRERLLALGGFGEDLVILEDCGLACRFARTRSLRSLTDCLVLYRQHPGNRSRRVEIHIEPGQRSLGRLFADPTLEESVRRQEARVWARFYAMLAGGYFQYGTWGECARWTWRALRTSPRVASYLAGMPLRRIQQRFTRPASWSFAAELPYGVIDPSCAGEQVQTQPAPQPAAASAHV